MASIFISCVSSEFASYRDVLLQHLTRHNLEVKVQEDFVAFGGATLEKLDEYIQHCVAVIHLCGDMTGSWANALSLQYIKNKYPDFGRRFPELQPVLDGSETLSYTQWEAWLAAYHGKRQFVVVPVDTAVRDNRYSKDPAETAHQKAHLAKLRNRGYYDEIKFASPDDLVIQLYRSKLGDILSEISTTRPSNLPYQTIGSQFKGREDDMRSLEELFTAAPGRCKGVALYGLGGMGKTRLAVEYALKHADEYSALLFVSAAEAGLLKTNIAALAADNILDLPEQAASDEGTRYAAVLHWLNEHKGWLLILDNADTPEATKEAEKLFAQLQQGNVLITARYDNWSKQLKKKQLELISKAAAVDFLLEATDEEREKREDDEQLAGLIADDLGYLALALEQARAYIATKELSLADYRKKWEASRAEVLKWLDEDQMKYKASVAITWQTSFDQLSAAAATLLNRLAWLAPDPIPKSLLEVPVKNADPIDAVTAREELKKYSLATSAADKKSFTVHRLVQEVTRNRMGEELAEQTLTESLRWVNAAFTGEPTDVRSWPVLEPLVPHVLALLEAVKDKEAEKDFTWLMNQVALLFDTKALYGPAEPIYRRMLEIDAQFHGPDHTEVATDLSNLAQLLQDTNRLEEAEPLMRRALEIDEKNFGPDHPSVARDLNNLASLLLDTNRLEEAEPLMRRALVIDENNFGPDHPKVAIRLNNLARLLQATNRLEEAEPLMRRVIEIFEKSYGADDPNVAVSLNNLASLFLATNRLEEAEPLMRRALAIGEKSFGPDHPKVAIRLNNLAGLLTNTNRAEEAAPLYQRAFTIFLKSYGPEHPNTNTIGNNYIILLQEMGKTEEEIKAVFEEMGVNLRENS